MFPAALSLTILSFATVVPHPVLAGNEASAASVLVGDTETLQVKVTGMTCAGCASQLHKALAKREGILENEMKYPGNVAVIKYDPAKVSQAEIVSLIQKAGYKAEIVADDTKASLKGAGKSCCTKS